MGRGGAIEIQCACNIWNSRIIVLNNRDREIEFIPLSGQYEMTMYLEWTGGHYEPLKMDNIGHDSFYMNHKSLSKLN